MTQEARPEDSGAPELAALKRAHAEALATARDFGRLRSFVGVAGVLGLASTWAVWEIFSGTMRGLVLLAGLALFFIAMLVFFAWSLTRAIVEARERAEELERRIRRLEGG